MTKSRKFWGIISKWVPAKRQLVAPQGNRSRRFTTEPGEAYQMDWGFAMVCHHCGQRYVEFFPNAKQENLFIGMIHALGYMGIPKCVLTNNMKSVVLHILKSRSR